MATAGRSSDGRRRGRSSDGPLIVLRRVHKVYLSGSIPVRALGGIDLQVDRGESLVVMAPSGCGRSTLLNLVGAVDTPTEGSVLVDGVSLATLDDNALTDFRRTNVGFVLQFCNLIPSLTAAEEHPLPEVLDRLLQVRVESGPRLGRRARDGDGLRVPERRYLPPG